MRKYEYKFIRLPLLSGMKVKPGDTLELCRQSITEESLNGWRLKQLFAVPDEASKAFSSSLYVIIFEREL